MRADLLLLCDGRFPSGGHAHSGGLEAAVAANRVHDIQSLRAFLSGRLATSGYVAGALAAAASSGAHDWIALDVEADARTPSPAQREASRRQGRALMRTARTAWPHIVLDSLACAVDAPHHPIALGAATRAAGLAPSDAAMAAVYGAVAGPASAGVRLLAFDPMTVARILADLAGDIDAVASAATGFSDGPLRDLPADQAPLLDIGAEWHRTWEVRLFAS